MRAERLTTSGLLGFTGSITAAAAAFGVALVVGNALGTSGTGLFFQAVGVFTIASQVLRLGTSSSIVHAISEQHAFGRHGEAWRTVVIAVVPVAVVSLVVGGVLWWAAPLLAALLTPASGAEAFIPYLHLMAVFVPAGAVLAVLQIASRMLDGITTYTVAHAIAFPLVRLLAVLAAVALGGAALDAFAAWLGVLPLWLVVAVLVLARPVVLDWRRRAHSVEPFDRASRRFWAYSSTRAVGGSLEIMLEWADVLIVAALTSPTEAGVYAVVTRVVRAGQLVDHSMRLAVSPAISRLLARGETEATRSLHTQVARAMILISWPFYLAIAVMGPAVLSLFGTGFETGAPALVILGAAMLVASGAGMLQSILLQGGHSSWQVADKSIALAASVALNLLLVPRIGIVGAALAWAVVTLLDTAIGVWQVHMRMGVGPHLAQLVPAMILPVVVVGTGLGAVRLLFGATIGSLVWGLGVVGIVYLALLWVLRRQLGILALWREAPGLRRLAERARLG
jgi:O-antigen/teichoic acid export membrane protein